MSKLVLTITDENILDKLLWMLKHFENNGLKIEKQISKSIDETKFTKEYIEENWRALIMTGTDNSNYYKSEQYKLDRAKDYEERGKI